jgi:hypothetical protein
VLRLHGALLGELGAVASSRNHISMKNLGCSMHFWAYDAAVTLAKGLKATLDRTRE